MKICEDAVIGENMSAIVVGTARVNLDVSPRFRDSDAMCDREEVTMGILVL